MISKDYLKRIERANTALNIAYRNTTDADERQIIMDELKNIMSSYTTLNDEFISFDKELKYVENNYPTKNELL